MRQALRRTLIHVLGLGGVFPTTLTRKEDLARLIRKLHPVAPGIEMIRLGPMGDGGYLVPDDLDGVEACFSPGVSMVSGFEKDCADMGMQVFLADKSVDGPAISHKNFRFIKQYVGAIPSDGFTTMDAWVTSSLPNSRSDLLLQIDIEGYEYETFLSMPDELMRRFRIIVAEFHSLHWLWSEPFFKMGSRVFERILQTHTCVHIHPNNMLECLRIDGLEIPRLMEFTFLRSDRVKTSSYADRFPHPLDAENCNTSALRLPNCWYGGA
jgi:hypothetical protein